MSDTFRDEVVSDGASAGRPVYSRAAIAATEDFSEGGDSRSTSAGAEEIWEGGHSTRKLPASTLALLDKMSATAAAEPEQATDAAPAEQPAGDAAPAATPATAEAAKPEGETKPAEKPAEAPPPEWKLQFETLTAERTRFEEANRRLLSEVETLRKAKPTAASRYKLAEEAVSDYLDNSPLAVRKFIAQTLGIEDPQHADVTAELQALALDLTAHNLGVPLDPTQQAARDAARVRQALAREKRERKAEAEATQQPDATKAEQAKADAAAQFITQNLKATDYPLLSALSSKFDGVSPGHRIWQEVQRGIQLGEYAPTASDDVLIATAAKKLETLYRTRADEIIKALSSSQPSTAATTPAQPDATKSASQAPPQGHGGRPLTTADASAAPATPPSTKAEPQKPKYETREQARKRLLARLDP